MDSGKVPVYCHMTSSGLGACGGGGWTLVMKTDGAKVFYFCKYNSCMAYITGIDYDHVEVATVISTVLLELLKIFFIFLFLQLIFLNL